MALALAACLMVPCGQAYASENETEMTGGFTPVELGSGTSSSGSSGSQGGGESGGESGEPSANETELSKGKSPSTEGQTEQPPQGVAGTEGIHLDNGSVVTVDDGGHLAIVGPAGNVSVISEVRSYVLERGEDGSVSIRDDAGDPVTVEGTMVSFTGADGERVSVGASLHALGADEMELSNEDEVSAEAQNAPARLNSAKALGILPLVAGVVAAIAAAVGVALWRRRQQPQDNGRSPSHRSPR